MTPSAEGPSQGNADPTRLGSGFLARFAELFLLSGFAVAQPLFSDLAPYPEFFNAHAVGPADLAGLVITLCCALPLALAAIGSAVAVVSEGGALRVHAACLGLLLATTVLQPLAQLAGEETTAAGVLVVSSVAGLAGAALSLLQPEVRGLLRLVAPLALVFPALFLGSETVRPLLTDPPPSAFTGPPIDSDTPVIVIVFDELPLASLMTMSGGIDRERYPHFAALADESHWFRNATTVSPSTGFAVGSLVASRRVRKLREAQSDNLFTLLSNGNGVLAYEASSSFCPPEISKARTSPPGFVPRLTTLLEDVRVLARHRLTPLAWRGELPDVRVSWRNFGRRASLAEVEFPEEHATEWAGLDTHAKLRGLAPALVSLHAGERPTLLFLHLMLPHRPWFQFPSGRAYALATPGHGQLDRVWVGTEWETTQALQRHLLQVGSVDRLLGLIVAELKETGLYDPALIAVLADHGHSFRLGSPDRSITEENFADVLSVPLLIKRPGQREAVVDDRNAETIDLGPTIADELGIEVPWHVDGRSLFDPEAPEPPEKISMRREYKRGDAPDLHYPTAALFAPRNEIIARIHSVFGEGVAGLMDVAPSRESRALLGQEISQLAVAVTQQGHSVELPAAQLLAAVDRSRAPVPANVIGRIERAARSSEAIDLAVAINGRIEAVTQTFPGDPDFLQFTVLLPEDALREGHNEVAIFEIRYEADSLELVPTRLERYSGPPLQRE